MVKMVKDTNPGHCYRSQIIHEHVSTLATHCVCLFVQFRLSSTPHQHASNAHKRISGKMEWDKRGKKKIVLNVLMTEKSVRAVSGK